MLLGLLLALAAIGPAAHAGRRDAPALLGERPSGFYLGGSWGGSRWDMGFDDGLRSVPDSHSLRAYVGAETTFAAVELAWVKLGQTLRYDAQGSEGSLLTRGFSVDLLLKLPIGGGFEPFVKAGPVIARTQVRGSMFRLRSDSLSDREAKFGIGLQWKPLPGLMLRAELERYTMGVADGIGGVTTATVGAALRF